MKVLIVDDSEAVQSTLTEALSADGFDVMAEGSADAAADIIQSFRPDAILLDPAIRNGLDIIDLAESKGQTVIVISAAKGSFTSPVVAGYVKKPFDSAEVTEKLRDLPVIREKPKRSIFRSFFGKKASPAENSIGPIYGRSYFLIEKEPDHAYCMISDLAKEGCQALILTSGKIKTVKERTGLYAKVIALSGKGDADHIEPCKMGTLMGMITDFTNANEKPAIMLDDMDLLIECNGMNSVVTMIHQIISDTEKTMTLIISMRSGGIAEKDRELLQNNMDIHIFR